MTRIKSTQDSFLKLSEAAKNNSNIIKNRDENTISGDVAEQQFYNAQTTDTTSIKLPIVYGTVLTKGTVIDESVTQAAVGLAVTEKDTINFKHYKILISEGDCNGIKANVHYHTVINNRPLIDPDTGITELNGVEIKQRTETNTSDWATSEKMSQQSKDVDISVFKGSTTNLADNVTRVGFLQGLSDVSTELTNGYVLQYNQSLDKFEGKHINDILNDAGMFTTTDADPSGTGTDIEKWVIPHAISYEVTLHSDTRTTQTPFRWWKAGANAGNTSGANDSIYAANVLKLDALFRPDIIMYDNITYSFVMSSSLGSGNGFYLTDDLTTEYTTGVTSTAVAAGTYITEHGTYTFTPTSATPRIMYYRTQNGVNTGGRILIRTP